MTLREFLGDDSPWGFDAYLENGESREVCDGIMMEDEFGRLGEYCGQTDINEFIAPHLDIDGYVDTEMLSGGGLAWACENALPHKVVYQGKQVVSFYVFK